MELECAQSFSSGHATEEDIQRAFAEDKIRGEYIILSQADQVFMQAAGEDEGPYILEYRDGGGDHHYQCPHDLTKDQVQAAFLKYLAGDTSWQQDHEWQPLEMKPWWKFW